MAELEHAYLAYAPELRRYLQARTGDTDTTEELLSTVFVEACARIGSWEDRPEAEARGNPLRAWLYRLAASRAIDHWRRERRRPSCRLGVVMVDGPEERIEMLDAAAVVRPALAGLLPRYRRVLQLRYVEQRSLEEAAAALGTTVGAVKALQHRAIEALRQAIGQ